ncbi:hypothetical protein QTP86_010698 [Hemibagrus guttatus]|nr:hypothetical protein QTP86_010698 [Hemibagrus guttatus]
MRKKVIEINQSGKGYKAIKALGLPRTTVRAIIYKWQKHGTVENLPRSGQPTKITPRAQRQLIQEVTKDPTTTSKELQASLASVKVGSKMFVELCHKKWVTALLLLYCLRLSASEFLWPCPQKCICKQDTLEVNCSSKHLTVVPEGLHISSKRLNLSGNRLKTLSRRQFYGLTQLEELDLSENIISMIEVEAFQGLKNLRILKIKINRLKIIPVGVFSGLSNLLSLDISRNEILVFLDYTFQEMVNLRDMNAGENDLVFISQRAFVGLQSLIELNVDRSNLTSIPTDAFSQLQSLTKLRLRRLNINVLPNNAFRRLHQLRTLHILQWPSLETLNSNSLVGLNLTTLVISNCNLSAIPYAALRHLTHLIYLDLSYNPITCIEGNMLGELLRLQEFHLVGGKLLRIEPGAFRCLVHFQLLNVSSNRLTTLEESAFHAVGNLQTLREQDFKKFGQELDMGCLIKDLQDIETNGIVLPDGQADPLSRANTQTPGSYKEHVQNLDEQSTHNGGKGRELADMMERRQVDILCVQETRWKGSKARSIGAGFKLFYYGVDSKRNGVGVVLKEEFVRNVLEVKRVSDRVMSLKLEIEGVMLNVVSGYAPQVGCELEKKERFWSELDEVMESIPTCERVVIGADFNGHVGEGNTGDEEVMGKFGVKERNLEGQMVVDFAKRMDIGVVNTYFQKREEHRVTYKSGGRRTQVDYILCRRGNLKEISDCKVVVGESVARQHRMVVCRMTLMVCKKKRSKIEKKTKWWKLKKEECCEEFRQKLRQALGGQVVLPDDWETTAEVIRETGRKVLGVSSGRRKEDKETWWWNEEVQDSIQRKRLAKKKWDMDRTEENRQEYKELQRRVKREVSKAKQKAYDELYTRLDTREGEKDLYRLARQRDRDGKDVQQVRVIKDRDGRVLTSEESVQRRWKEYFEELMNEENEREKRVERVNSVEQKVDKIRKDEVRKALKRMKSGKAVGPDDIPVEVWKCLGEAAVEFLASLFNRVLESERMPEEWRRSVLVPIFKNKGDMQSCSNYRGIKLMSHTMKLWERVVEARLRKVVEICEQQYGFMPRKSATDAIFALRILMEKYRDGQRELHCVFVDLEKAYDRVPREELWYCMRKSGVVEKYVRVVQDMYERSRTVVRCAVGQTEEFNVEVGLHQGSALSPFLFAIVMDQLSEEVRQESPWTMMFADDIVICSESREQVEENLERWRFALERRGMKVSRSKTEYMCVNEREGSGTVRLQGEEVKKVQEFKYLGSTVQSNGECGKEVKKRVQAGWNGWRKVSGVLCDQKISARIKGKVYRTVVRPAMLYGLETVSLRKRQESELEVAELKMLRFSLGVTRLDRIRNEYIRGTAHVGRLGDKVREARLRWFGHVQRRESEYIGRRMLDMGLPGRRQRGRPKRRYMDGMNEDMKLVGASVEDAEDRDRWREMIRCGDP